MPGGTNPGQFVNAQTGTTYTFVDQDGSKLVTFTNAAAVAVTLPQAGGSGLFMNGWYVDVQNKGTTIVTITPTTSTINGASSLALGPGQGCRITSDAVAAATGNYQIGLSGGSAGTPNSTLTSISTGLTAHAGGGQTSALALVSAINVVSTVATGNDSVALPLGVAGMVVTVINSAASNSMQVFGAGTDTINAVATATGVAQAAGKTATYYCTTTAPAAAWFRLLSA